MISEYKQKEEERIFNPDVGASKAYFLSKVQQKYPTMNKKDIEIF